MQNLAMKQFKCKRIFFVFVALHVYITTQWKVYSFDQDKQCIAEEFGPGNIVCMCNSTYCDTVKPLDRLPIGQYWVVTSTKDGQRFNKEQKAILQTEEQQPEESITLSLNHSTINQTIIGFGGAISDASAINIVGLSSGSRDNFMRSYFSSDGIEYTLARVPIGGTDFSPRNYSYDDNNDGDFNLDYFQLTEEDTNFKIPVIQEAMQLSNYPIKLFATPWSSPGWMKTNNELIGKGYLKGDVGELYYQTWANYYLKFLQEYKKHNITFWAVTTQNEPLNGNMENFKFNCLGFDANSQKIFIGENLGPTLDSNGYGDVAIIMLDDQRLLLPQWAEEVLRDDFNAKDYISGIAFHWYLNFLVPSTVLTKTHELFPDKFLISTEACEGAEPFEKELTLGHWDRGEHYASDIIDDLQHWTTGWVDWNICLDENGGPNWIGGKDDSPIIVIGDEDIFYKQPMFYALGHFSKFVNPGSVVIEAESSATTSTFLHITFDSPDNSTVLVILNTSDKHENLVIYDPYVGTINAEVPSRSIQTYVWWH